MKPELMAPVSDWISLRAAIEAGADAVYFGIKQMNMRVTAKNFELTELKKVVDFCHLNKVYAYITLNTIIYNNELDNLKKILAEIKKTGCDAVICWDMSVISAARELEIDVILSTQASVANIEAAKFFEKLGVKRIVLARECNLEDIRQIKAKTSLEIEVFVHGAMCVSVSGRCFMSQFLYNKSANRGDCLQPCRRAYIVEDPEEHHRLELHNDYIMSPKDLCTLSFIDKLIQAGVDSCKIEGRARSPEYVKTITSVYRKAIDLAIDGKLTPDAKKGLAEEANSVYNRGFSDGFYLGQPISEWTDTYGSKATTRKIYVGYVKNYFKNIAVAEIALKTQGLRKGNRLMIQGPTTGIVEQCLESIEFNHTKLEEAKKGQSVGIKINKIVRPGDKVFVIEKSSSSTV